MLHPNARPLDRWVLVPEAASILGVTKQAVHKMLASGVFRNVRTLGEKPIYVIARSEVEALRVDRDSRLVTAETA